MNMALSVRGIDYLCDAIVKGWGISSEILSTKFSTFINGKYVYRFKKPNGKYYTSEMYCNCIRDKVKVRTNFLTLIDCDVVIEAVGRFPTMQIFATGKCDITLNGDCKYLVTTYGKEDNIKITNNSSNAIRTVKAKRDADDYNKQNK